eukprot:snap_masked-scaffold_26-processed-gene-4.59-mRNA-1 protein AED:0.16 eAED:0.16 QI:0/-1/0/1/-1/1/1/0/351
MFRRKISKEKSQDKDALPKLKAVPSRKSFQVVSAKPEELSHRRKSEAHSFQRPKNVEQTSFLYSMLQEKEKEKVPKSYVSDVNFESSSYKEKDFKIYNEKTLEKENIESKRKYFFSSLKLNKARRESYKSQRVQTSKIPGQNRKDQGKLTVVLDVDETLIHSTLLNYPTRGRFKARQDQFSTSKNGNSEACDSFQLTLADGEKVLVTKRPGLDQFLASVGEKYEIMAYTAGLRQYASPLLDWLDPEKKIFRYRFYRDSCLFVQGYYLKDLDKVNRDLSRAVLVDNNMCCFLPQLANGVPISTFIDDPKDDALWVLERFLDSLASEKDVRPVLETAFNLEKVLSTQRDVLLG